MFVICSILTCKFAFLESLLAGCVWPSCRLQMLSFIFICSALAVVNLIGAERTAQTLDHR